MTPNNHRYSRAFRAAIEAYRASRANRRMKSDRREKSPLQRSSATGDTQRHEEKQVSTVAESARTAEDSQKAAAKRLAAALAGYTEQLRISQRPDPDIDLESARRKMELAKRIVTEGGISQALCGSLLGEVLRWERGIKQTDFLDNLPFEANEIRVDVQRPAGIRLKADVAFVFEGRRFQIEHLDRGERAGFDMNDTFRHFKVDLYADDHLVLALDVSHSVRGPHSFASSTVTALVPGDWMQDLLRISAKIESHTQRKRSSMDNDVLEAGARINLPDDLQGT